MPFRANDLREQARATLSSLVWDYIDGGAGDEITLRRNIADFDSFQVVPRILNDVSRPDLRTTLLGFGLSAPILLGPVSPLRLVSEDAEFEQARAANEFEILSVVSTNSHNALEDLAPLSPGRLWFQIFPFGSKAWIESLVNRAEMAGYKALVLTVDAFYPAMRERMARSLYSHPDFVRMGNLECANSPGSEKRIDGSYAQLQLTWEGIRWLKSISRLPLIIKGVLHPDDAKRALDFGCDGIVVSNHGGRQQDSVPSSITTVASIRRAVGDHPIVLMDGGITRGLDVLKAIALGADAVLLGRSYVWALAANGFDGVRDLIAILSEELRSSMQQLGVSTIKDINSLEVLTR